VHHVINDIYSSSVSPKDKPLIWLHGEVKSPPLSREGRIETGYLLRRLQKGEVIGMPASRPMPAVGRRCHELRVTDSAGNWRLMYRADADAIVILEVFAKKTRATPKTVIETCQTRLKEYDNAGKQTPKARR
jgi:phage-related protein